MGSDSKVSCGMASEDVGVPEEEGNVHRVLEQDAWIELVIEANPEIEPRIEPEIEAVPDSGVLRPEADLVTDSADSGAEAEGK